MKTFKLHLIRHGMTAGNLQGLYIGSGTDIPLCDEGRAQLNDLKERFEYPQVDTVFSSPLLRAVETANILFPDAKHTFTVHDRGRPALASLRTSRSRSWCTTRTLKSGSPPAPAMCPKAQSLPTSSTPAAPKA